jgi:predicted transcriptional regulator
MLANHSNPFDESFAKDLERYLKETLHSNVSVVDNHRQISAPTFLERSYRFYEAQIIGRRCILIAASENVATPTNISKHVSLVRSAVDAIVIFATPTLSAHNRSRLLALGVAFVVPGNQLYIPELAMDLREHFRAFKPQAAEGLSPAAQAVLFHYLLRLDQFATTPSEIAERLHYSPMTIGRAFDDLVSVGLAKTKKLGKERHIYFVDEMGHLMDLARPMLRSPVRSVKYLCGSGEKLGLKRAGETALSRLTDLSPPRQETFAVPASDWKAIVRTLDLVEGNEFEHDFAIETWSYDPAGLSSGPLVDPLSLYAQFKGHQDERVSMAADSLLRNLP